MNNSKKLVWWFAGLIIALVVYVFISTISRIDARNDGQDARINILVDNQNKLQVQMGSLAVSVDTLLKNLPNISRSVNR